MVEYTHIAAKKEVKPLLLFLRSFLEPKTNRVLSISDVVTFSIEFISSKLDDKSFELEFIDFIKKIISKGEGEEDEEGVNSAPPEQ